RSRRARAGTTSRASGRRTSAPSSSITAAAKAGRQAGAAPVGILTLTGVARLRRGYVTPMSEREQDEDGGRFAVPGDASAESDETLSPDEGGAMENQPLPGPSEPK